VAHARSTRSLSASPDEVWKLIADPHHMPRWWPGVTRMEGVSDEHFTQVFVSKRGRTVRMDFDVLAVEPPWRMMWEQELAGTPFERVLGQSITEIVLEPEGTGTRVTIEQRQKLKGYSRTGTFMMRRATRDRLSEALEGLDRVTSD
jgi:uncharacterized protein YndB with AHSA1/START domain